MHPQLPGTGVQAEACVAMAEDAGAGTSRSRKSNKAVMRSAGVMRLQNRRKVAKEKGMFDRAASPATYFLEFFPKC